MSGRTAVEKIVARHAVGWDGAEPPRAGDFVSIRPRHIMTHDNTSAVMSKFHALAGADGRVHDPAQPVIAIDHDIQNHTPENLGKYSAIRRFAEKHGLRHYPPGRGIAHQVMIEEGFVAPGSLVVGSDSHSNMYGALSALGTPVVRTDAAAIWATGETWWVVPEQVRVTLRGSLPAGVTGKDVILALCRVFPGGEALNAAVEFAGEGVGALSNDDRLTIANMSTEWGALAAWFPRDAALDGYLGESGEVVASDPDAVFVRELELDLSSLCPHVTGPNSVWASRPAAEFEREPVRIDKAYLMSCVNGRLSDLRAAAAVFGESRRVAEGVEFYIAAASAEVERAARAEGIWQRLESAGAIALPSGCGACIGLGRGTLEPGEVGISATNRNFEGRMGSRDADCYLAGPAVVAESAIRGVIAAPAGTAREPVYARRETPAPATTTCAPAGLVPGFPGRIRGRTLVLTRDNIDTDGIYGKDVTYRDDITPEQQGQYALLNHAPEFQGLVRAGDVLVAGRNFGTGSSREQAATALRSAGVSAIVAASVGRTFQRNALNNGVIVIECPGVFEQLAGGAEDRLLVGPEIEIDFAGALVRCGGREHPFTPLGTVAQRLVVAGGLEPMVRDQLHPIPELVH